MSNEPEIIPDKLWLAHVIVIMRQAQKQTGTSLVYFLESFEEDNPEWNPDLQVDTADDKTVLKALQKYMKKHYPDEPRPTIT